ncbi:helix-turn-helix transcriptional regulator [Chitinibacter bivalviorum]|uniref:Helix-turn-helix transcriptional regulator n=1 Tax=Chitinibacter bivalviorum TaxID=2739434 RepID=A0A7H9BL48_9NEIS|nr:AraC family transcriptional regulator [Chitinibacter bivalviorum]QLG89405.1 helix-turn-helix transcriptional regulator [Chitinibacter bivalviorum]
MSMIYQELFDVGPETQQMSVGSRVYHHPHLAALADYDVLFMGLSEARGLMHVERRGAPFHVLMIGVEGQGEIITGDAKLAIGPNQLAILPAYSHSGFRRVSEHWRCVWFLLNDAPRWNALAGDTANVRSVQNAHSLFYAMYALCYEARLNQHSFSGEALILVMDLLKRMLASAVVNEALADRLRALFSGIRFAPAQAWRVEQLAEQYGVCSAQFQRLCLKNLGATPLQLIIEQRMLRARELLSGGRYSVSEVAVAVGYEEIASFSRRFRSHFGYSPSAVKKENSSPSMQQV